MFKQTLVLLMMLVGVSAMAETPKEGAQAILTLLKERNYTEIFQTRYCEWYKVEAEGVKPEAAIEKLSGMWEKNHDKLVLLYEQLAGSEFELSQREMPHPSFTGDVATATVTFSEQKIPYSLFKMNSGLWGFRL